MADLFKFLKQNRPEIGLVDRYDLSEIYDSDERVALRNLLLDPDSLDQIYGLSKKGLTREDIRSMGGLDKSVIHSLALADITLDNVLFTLSQQITTDKAIGEPGKHSFSTDSASDNILVFHGGIGAKKIEYNFLDSEGEIRTTTVPTSRESLFNSLKDSLGRYESVSYPGLFRIRRRSHINQLRLASKLLIPRGTIIESPTSTINLPVYMRTNNNPDPSVTTLQCYATKNSPLILPVRIFNSATISFSRDVANSGSPAFVYGWELKRASDLRAARSATISSSGAISTVTITINTAGTICNGVRSLLYIYLDPSAINSANLSNLGMEEIAGKDIGLVGFDNLKELNLAGNNLSTLPVWLKTLHGTLKKLNLSGNSFWNNGIVSFFDWQEPPTGVTGGSRADFAAGDVPNITLAQVLGYSGHTNSGKIAAYDGSYGTMQDNSGRLYKNQRSLSISGGALPQVTVVDGFRPFNVLEELILSSHVRLANADFSTLFPNLKTLGINANNDGLKMYWGLIPKLRNNGSIMALDMQWHREKLTGSIRYLGNRITWNGAADLSTTATSGNGTIATITFAPQGSIPFPVGSTVVVRNVVPAGYNGSYTVTSATTSSVSYANTTTGSQTTSGSVGSIDGSGQFIGQFKFSYFNINNQTGTYTDEWSGGICTTDSDTDIPDTTIDGLRKYSFVSSGSAADAWSGWLAEMQELHIYYRDIAFRIASGNVLEWKKLRYVICHYCGIRQTYNKVGYNIGVGVGTETSSDILRAPQLGHIDGWRSGWYGKIFSIQEAKTLRIINIGNNNWEGYQTSDGRQYILPSNFANQATSTSFQELQQLYLHYLIGAPERDLEFRQDDLKNLPRLTHFYVDGSYFTGKFPTVYSGTNTEGVRLHVWIYANRFRDLSALGSTNTDRLALLYAPQNGTGVGGSLSPNFSTLSPNNVLNYVNLDSTLSSRYPGNWIDENLRGKLIGPLVTGAVEQITAPVTWTSRNNNNTANAVSDKLYQSNVGGWLISSQVMVGDEIFQGAISIGVVTQIDRNNGFIYIDRQVSLTGAVLTFRRKGQDISSFFNNHTNLDQLYIRDIKASGLIPLFVNCTNLRQVYMGNNLLTNYQTGTLKNITGVSTNARNTPTLQVFSLEYNTLTKESVKRIINEAHEIAVYFRARGINPRFTIGLYATKYNSATMEYQNWIRSEIFDQSTTVVNAAGETVTSPDPLETRFNQLGTGKLYPGINIQLF